MSSTQNTKYCYILIRFCFFFFLNIYFGYKLRLEFEKTLFSMVGVVGRPGILQKGGGGGGGGGSAHLRYRQNRPRGHEAVIPPFGAQCKVEGASPRLFTASRKVE